MADEVVLDRSQVKKAVQALQAFLKSQSKSNSQLLDEAQKISVQFTLWKIPRQAQTIRIPLPHGQRTDTDEICLFTKDEPNMTPEQTQRFYKKLLEERGVKGISEVIPYKMLKAEYKPFEAKRRLLGNFDVFLSDDRIRRLLPSQLGKEFYKRKREPLCVDLQSKHLARDVQRLIQGTKLNVTNKGSCCLTHVGHSSMTADEVTENVQAAFQTVLEKIRMKGPIIKAVHLKSLASVALPVYCSNLKHLSVLDAIQTEVKNRRQTTNVCFMFKTHQVCISKLQKAAAKRLTKTKQSKKSKKQTNTTAKRKEEEEEEEIPQLVPIETPTKKPKLEKPIKKNPPQKTPKPAVKKAAKAPGKRMKRTGKMESKGRRKVQKTK
ncbi:Ribosomal L1 domain-containing protein 1 [Oryzias melastigma]|uniref:Ribosomal L1 domain-containing protein 1 n=1 Tax=Oryzias melastigma TaxID=30732 RepID=A0A834CRS6_ORYME|nr:Ribosomal L1 domain-containing protein 1 [Oryzias melastigma]